MRVKILLLKKLPPQKEKKRMGKYLRFHDTAVPEDAPNHI